MKEDKSGTIIFESNVRIQLSCPLPLLYKFRMVE